MRCDKFFILEKFYIQIFLILTCISDVEVACQPSKLDSRVQFPAGAKIIIILGLILFTEYTIWDTLIGKFIKGKW